MKLPIALDALPVHLDGSDGSVWASRDTWADIFTHPGLAARRFVRVSDLILWLEANGIECPLLPHEQPQPQVECPVKAMIDHSEQHFSEPTTPV